MKSVDERKMRRTQLAQEMEKVNLPPNERENIYKTLEQKESNFLRAKRSKLNKSMFETIKIIGRGGFGEVALVLKKDDEKLFAMKTMRKSDVIKKNQMAHVKAERDILAECDNDWVVKLYFSFQDADHLYLIMEYIPGGDLMSLLIKQSIFSEPLAQFYIAELVCAIESVHRISFIHRDIKPDNILIDSDGHIKLTDFGLCTGFRWTHSSQYYQSQEGQHGRQPSMDVCGDLQLECRCQGLKPLERRHYRQHLRCSARTVVGTPNYIAPEVLSKSGTTELSDWWSVGVILYEMLVGRAPFAANKPHETQERILNWQTTLVLPPPAPPMSRSAEDLIRKLLTAPEQRLGRNGTHEIKSHAFFRGIDFATLRQSEALWKPSIAHPLDTRNFDTFSEDEPGPSGPSEMDPDAPTHGFYEYTYRRFFLDEVKQTARREACDDPDPVYV